MVTRVGIGFADDLSFYWHLGAYETDGYLVASIVFANVG